MTTWARRCSRIHSPPLLVPLPVCHQESSLKTLSLPGPGEVALVSLEGPGASDPAPGCSQKQLGFGLQRVWQACT